MCAYVGRRAKGPLCELYGCISGFKDIATQGFHKPQSVDPGYNGNTRTSKDGLYKPILNTLSNTFTLQLSIHLTIVYVATVRS